MANIMDCLANIRGAVYGKDVREAIASGIEQCYADGHAGSVDPTARYAIEEVAEEVDTLRSAVGSPLVAQTVAGMTDQNKIYVYTGSETGYTSGNWYYYNGSAWVSGGVYNATAISTDTSLSVGGAAADAAAVGVLKSALKNIQYTYYFSVPPGSLGKYYFNPTAGSISSDTKRLTVMEGVPLFGCPVISVEITPGYKWNVYFATVDGSYSFVSQYSNVWLEQSIDLIPVPNGANRVYIQCLKTDGSSFTDNEMSSVFRIRLVAAKEKQFYEYDNDTDFTSEAYGNYQYVGTVPNVGEWSRLTCDRFYEIVNGTIILEPKQGYKCVINFFDSGLARLGNNGSWITEKSTIYLYQHYQNAKYFRISYAPASGSASLDHTDYNAFTVIYPCALSPVALTKTKLQYVDALSFSSGDIAVYGNTTVVGDTGHYWIDGVQVDVENGHANNFMFGKTLYNDFPKLYAGGWYTWNKCVFVNAITANSATLLDTITFADLPTGYINMCVDEPNERFYIFEETGADTYAGEILFAVCDFSGNVISQRQLPYSIPLIQGMHFDSGIIYLTSGDGTATYPNSLWCFDINGNVVSKTDVSNFTEIEGISVSDGAIYIKFLRAIYKISID